MNIVFNFEKNDIIPNITQFKTRPIYGVQVNKNKCRVLIACNDIPHWLTFFDNVGESMLAYLNNYIPKSGPQSLTVQVFPKEGDEFIAPDAAVDIRITTALDKDSPLTEYKTLVDTSLSDVLKNQKLPYYEFQLPFEATVPFDFSKELDSAKDLTKIPDIEKMVYAKYSQLRDYIVKGEAINFLNEQKDNQIRMATYLYASKEDFLSDQGDDNTDVNMLNISLPHRKVPTLDSCELVFGYHGKVALLREKRNKKDAIRVAINEEKDEENAFSTSIVLYIPAGSNELKIW